MLIFAVSFVLTACSSAAVYAPKEIVMYTGETRPLGAAVVPFGSGGTVTYSSADTAVAVISSDGTITAIGNGETVITSRLGGSISETTVRVYTRAEEIFIDELVQMVYLEDSETEIKYRCEPQDSVANIEWEAVYEEDDEEKIEIVEISSGNLIGRRIGTAKIKGTYEYEGEVQTVEFDAVVVNRSAGELISALRGISILGAVAWETGGGYSVLAEITNKTEYGEDLQSLGAITRADGIDSYYADLSFGYRFRQTEDDILIIYINDKEKLELNLYLSEKYISFEGIYIFRAEPLRETEFRLFAVTDKTRDEVVEIFLNVFGSPKSVEDNIYIYEITEINHNKFVFRIIVAENDDGIIDLITIEISRVE